MSDTAVEHARAYFESLGLGADADPELSETPERFTEFLREIFEGVDESPPSMSTFETEWAAGDASPDPVILGALPFHSMCVHHMVPFFGTIDVAYLPGGEMVGFGSVGRVIDHFSHRPQVQERLVNQIADHLKAELDPRGVLVRCRARQMCMEMRGAEKDGVLVASAAHGELTDGERRREVLRSFAEQKDVQG